MNGTASEFDIIFNGASYRLSGKTTISMLIEKMGIKNRRIAVELNQEIVPKSGHSETFLEEGDHLEVVHAIGGG